MTLVNMTQLLDVAKKNHFAVGAYNVSDLELMRITIEQCEADYCPAIVMIHPTELRYCKDDFIAYVLTRIRDSKIPVALHLDHGDSVDSAARAIHDGFSSVMIDMSLKDWDTNVKETAETVKMAHRVGVSVEGEVGTIGQNNVHQKGNKFVGQKKEGIYTTPEEAVKFVKDTGVDTLAVAIGTSHGIYPSDVKPKIRIDILKKIVNALPNTPLVLHGGSSNPDDQIADAVKNGISKVNISSDYKHAYMEAVRKILSENDGWDPNTLFPPALDAGKKIIHHKNELFNSVGKAKLYEGMDPWRAEEI